MDSVAGMLGLLSSFYWRLTQLLLRRRTSAPDDAYSLESGAWQGDGDWYKDTSLAMPTVEQVAYASSALGVPSLAPWDYRPQGMVAPAGQGYAPAQPPSYWNQTLQATPGAAPPRAAADIPLYYHRHNTPPRPRQAPMPAGTVLPQGAIRQGYAHPGYGNQANSKQGYGVPQAHDKGGQVGHGAGQPALMVPGRFDPQGRYLAKPDLPPPPKYAAAGAAGQRFMLASPELGARELHADNTLGGVRDSVMLQVDSAHSDMSATAPAATPGQPGGNDYHPAGWGQQGGECQQGEADGSSWPATGPANMLRQPSGGDVGLPYAWQAGPPPEEWVAAVDAAGGWTPAHQHYWELLQQQAQAQPLLPVHPGVEARAWAGHVHAGNAEAGAGDVSTMGASADQSVIYLPAMGQGLLPPVAASAITPSPQASPPLAPWQPPGHPLWQGQGDQSAGWQSQQQVLLPSPQPQAQVQEQQLLLLQREQPPPLPPQEKNLLLGRQGSSLFITDSSPAVVGAATVQGSVPPSAAPDAQVPTPLAVDSVPHNAAPAPAIPAADGTKLVDKPGHAAAGADTFLGGVDGAADVSYLEIPYPEIVFGQLVGEGAFGRVYAATWRGDPVAVKVLSGAAARSLDDKMIREFRRELATMARLTPHPNVLRMVGACSAPSAPLALVSELCSQGSLWALLHSPDVFLSWVQVLAMARGAAEGLAHLHGCNPPILHRDLKSSNLLLDDHFQVKVADFGLSRVMAHAQTMTGGCGTFQWMAPEVLAHQRYSERADVYSFGILLWEMSTRQVPFDGMSGMQAAMAVMGRGLRPPLPPTTPAPLAALIRRCWDPIPLSRPVMSEIVATLTQMQAEVGEWT
eukprot:jgi/Mesvir1/23264/Mv12878-RA.1